jgi:hypothetical protein
MAPDPAKDAFLGGGFFAGVARPSAAFAFPAAFADLFVAFADLLLLMTLY